LHAECEDKVFIDRRGVIRWVWIGDRRVNLIHTWADMYRSGDVHPNTQYDVLIGGEVCITMPDNEITLSEPLDTLEIGPGIPHLFYFPKETWLLEWWDGPFKAQMYPLYRAIVEHCIKGGQA
jgi:hypothetical protein